MKLFNLRVLITSGWVLMITNPIVASTGYSKAQCQQIASAIVNGQRPPLTNDELAELDGETAQQLTQCLIKMRQEKVQQANGKMVPNQSVTSQHEVDNQSDIKPETTRPGSKDQSHEVKSEIVSREPLSVEQQRFVDLIAQDAKKVAEQNDLYASVLIAQSIIESNWGRSELARDHHNLFGIKGTFHGMSATLPTKEKIDGHELQINAAFRHYSTVKESLNDYAQVLAQPMYSLAHKSKCHDYKEATIAIGRVYATDPQYHQKLNQLIQKYDLTQYDQLIAKSQSDHQEKPQPVVEDTTKPEESATKIKNQHSPKKGIVLPLIGGIGSMSLIELIKRFVK